jgi:hypothetical protein
MKIENTNWSLLSDEKDVQCAIRSLQNIKMTITETFGKYKLTIGHGFIYIGNVYYDLKSKDIVSACNEANDIAREEFTRLVEWNTRLIQELGDN